MMKVFMENTADKEMAKEIGWCEWESIDEYYVWLFEKFKAEDDMGILLSTWSPLSRYYLCEIIRELYANDDLSTLPDYILWAQTQWGDNFKKFIALKKMKPIVGEQYDPYEEPVPIYYIQWLNKAFSNGKAKFFFVVVGFIINGNRATEELKRRGLAPELVVKDENAYHIAENWFMNKTIQQDYPSDGDTSSFELVGNLTYSDIILEGTWEWMKYLGEKGSWESFILGLEGKLDGIKKTIIQRDIIDKKKKDIRINKSEITESRIDARRKAQGDETNTPFLNTLPSQESISEEPINLKTLALIMDELKPKELLLIEDMLEATNKGFALYSKQGLSLRQYWGKDYDRKIKAFNRLRGKLKKK